MKHIQTSDRVSSLAGQYADVSKADLLVACETDAGLSRLQADIRTMCASLLRQDQHKGLRGLMKRAKAIIGQ